MCIRFGRIYIHGTDPTVSGVPVRDVECCRYLGVFLNSGSTLKCNFGNAQTCFFRTINALYSKGGRLASKGVVLSVICAKCSPIILCDCNFHVIDTRLNLQ